MTPPIRVLVLTVAVAATLPSSAASQSRPLLTLDDAVRVALARNSAVDRATLAEEHAEDDLAQARTRQLPVLSVETQMSRLLRPVDLTFPSGAFGSFPSTGPVPSIDTTVTTPARMTMLFNASASQPVTGLLKAGLGIQQAERSRALAREDVRATRLQIVQHVKHAYYAILEAQSALDAADTNGRLLAELRRVVTNRIVQQVALKADGLEVDARLAQHELTAMRLRHAIASNKEVLNQLLGRDVTTEFDVVPTWDPTPGPADDRSDTDTTRRPDIRQAQLRVEQADLAVRQARAETLPDLNLVIQTITPVNIDGAPRNITSAGVQVKWEPFDWGRKARVVAARRIDARRADRALQDTQVAAHLDVNRARRTLEQARASLRAATLAQDVAREHARVRTTQYQTRAVLLSDVLQAQSTLAESTNQYQRAVLSLLTAQADLDHAVGEDPIP